MLIVVSPAKKMDMKPAEGVRPTQPIFADRAQELAAVARDLSVEDLQKLMHISENLAKLNYDRFRDFGQMERKAAALAFAGPIPGRLSSSDWLALLTLTAAKAVPQMNQNQDSRMINRRIQVSSHVALRPL